MKKPTLIIALLLIVVAMYSQRIVLAGSVAEQTTTRNWNDAVYGDVESLFIIIDEEGETVVITNGWEDRFIILESTDDSDISGKENFSTAWLYCLDQDNVRCTLLISIGNGDFRFARTYKFRVRILYENLWYGYYCNLK